MIDFKRVDVLVCGAGIKTTVPGIEFDDPSLCVAMVNFGYFCVTDKLSGANVFGYEFERLSSAVLALFQLQFVFKKYKFDFKEGIETEQVRAALEMPCPIPGYEYVSVLGWIQSFKVLCVTGEFPWEEESPYEAAEKISDLMGYIA